ncbi:MAG: transposase [Methylococcales bacterium]|nr:transposase [Methylococcales bacterium]
MKQKDSVLYELIAFCIMPNHVHFLIKPLDNLARVMQLIKGGSAKLINEKMGRKERFWLADYYDKLIQDDKHFSVVYEYIRNNPVGLDDGIENSIPRFYGIYD